MLYTLPLTSEELERRLLKVSDLAVHPAIQDGTNIKVALEHFIEDGSEIKFKAPVDCSAVSRLAVQYTDKEGQTLTKYFAFADANGNDIGVLNNLFSAGAIVKVVIDLDASIEGVDGAAFVQNADTNAYLEEKFADVSEQIATAINGIELPDEIYKQNEEPVGAQEGALWLDTDEEIPIDFSNMVDVALAQAKDSGEFDGEPGHTPVKGTDYWTTEDQEFIIQQTAKRVAENEQITEEIATVADYSIIGFCRPAPKGGELFGTTNIYNRTDYVDISEYSTIVIHCRPRSDSVSPCVWFDANKNYISGENATVLEESDFTYDVPENAVYAVFSTEKTMTNEPGVRGIKILDFNAKVNNCLANVYLDGTGETDFNLIVEKDSVIKKVNAEKILKMNSPVTFVTYPEFNIDGFCRPKPKDEELFGTNTSYTRTDYIDISVYDTIIVHCRPKSTSVSPCTWFDINKNYISGEEVTEAELKEANFTYEVPNGAVYAIFSSAKTTTGEKRVIGNKLLSFSDVVYDLKKKLENIPGAQAVCYISTGGSDENDGLTADTPVLTLSRVNELLDSNGELIFTEGDYYNFDYDLSNFSKVTSIGNVRLIYYSEKFTSATLVDGYTKVYSIPYTGSYSKYLWQFDAPDTNTEISQEERHPLQRNRSYRLEHTRLYPVIKFDETSTDLSGFLTTMETSVDKYMYYMDGENCYFTAPNTDFVTNPIIVPMSKTLKASEKRTVNISGLKIYFANILTTNLSGVLDNLTVGYNAEKDAIRWDNTFNLTLNNCEVVASMRDGINGHYNGDITCYNCWGHDCPDDGESDHEECHIIQYGGLYEYNGNGCTPASGASGEYINTIVRKSGAWDWVDDPTGTGFSAQGEGALMYCIGCHTSDCIIGFRQYSSGKSTYVNCVSKNDVTAYHNGTQVNCSTLKENEQYNTETWTFEMEDGSTVSKQVVVLK